MRPMFFSLLSAALLACVGAADAAQAEDAKDLRICAAQNDPPFSIKDGSGFENRIAVALADAMGRKPVFVWSDKPSIYLVRDYLDKKLCDVVIGLDKGDERVATSAPYYRSSYVFLTRADRNLDVASWTDPRIAEVGHIVVGFGTPGEAMLKEKGLYENNMAYLYSLVDFKAPRNQYTQIPPARIVEEVVSGRAELGVAFGPEVARYVKASASPLRMTVVTNDAVRADGTKIEQHFDQSVGARKDDAELLQEVDAGLVKARDQILAILRQEGVALLDGGM